MANRHCAKLVAIAVAGPLCMFVGAPAAGESESNKCAVLVDELNRSLKFATADPPGFSREMYVLGDMFRVRKTRDPELYCTYVGSWIEETIEVPLRDVISILDIENIRSRGGYVSLPLEIVGSSRRKVAYCNGSVSHGGGPSSQITLFLGEDAYPNVHERFQALLAQRRSCSGG